MMEKNICMNCGKKSKNYLKLRVYKSILDNDYRDFCSTECLIAYYKVVLKQERAKWKR